jgi:hypothetical protein
MAKSNNTLFGRTFITIFWLTFLGITIAGIVLIWGSVQSTTPTHLNLNLDQKGVKVELTTMVIGIIVFLMGAIGLLLMAIRIPVKEILGYKNPQGGSPGGMNFTLFTLPQMILSDRIEKIPILFWWLIRNRGRAVRIEKSDN